MEGAVVGAVDRSEVDTIEDRQKWYYDRVTSTIQLMPGDVVLMKLDVFQGKRKAKDRWSEAEYMVVHQAFPSGPCKGECHTPGRKRVHF